jgi:DNA-binding SARP family transcriptional activator
MSAAVQRPSAAWLRVLGPVQMWVAGRPIDLGPAKQRTLFAVLLVNADQPVSLDTLIDLLWDAPPAGARSGVYSYITRLRRVLAKAGAAEDEPVRLVNGAGGYLLDVDSDRVDLHRFRRLVARAREGADPPERRAALLDEAVDLWQGPALVDLPGSWAARVRDTLEQQRLDAVLLWARSELDRGCTTEVIGSLRNLAAEHPLVEPLAALLIEAFCLAGRTAEALDWYAQFRHRLVDELGSEPNAELRRLHRAMLTGELDRPAVEVRPAQLPLDLYGFVGRKSELQHLDTIMTKAGEQPTTVIVSAVSGPPGVGKTALVVHWAHRVADRFPDGQLYINLRGDTLSDSPMAPTEALRGFLESLGVPAERLPTTVHAQAGLYRSLLAGRRMLVLLDNAASAEQVRPLLPGAAGCLAVITSRNRLTGLVAADGALLLTLDVLSRAQSRRLLAHRIGGARVAAEPHAVDEIVTGCAGLPLALAIVAAEAAANPRVPLAVLADLLRGQTALVTEPVARGRRHCRAGRH